MTPWDPEEARVRLGLTEDAPSPHVGPSAIAELWRTISGPTVCLEVLQAREAHCQECPQRREVGDKSYCGACGCPSWSLAELSTKLGYARLACPLGRFHAIDEEKDQHLLDDSGIASRLLDRLKKLLR